MAETKIFFTKCRLCPNGSSLKEEYGMEGGYPEVDYFESIESPTISMTVKFIDVDQVIGRKGITGGELIELTVKDGDEDEFIITKEHRMMLNAVIDLETTDTNQTATLEFISEEAIINETSRLNKKFSGNVSQTVKDILSKDKKGIQTKKKIFGPEKETIGEIEIEADRAANSYAFVGNLKRPFDTIQWLCPKTQSSKTGFGFLFFETLDGYHFRSIEKLLKQEALRYDKAGRPLLDRPLVLQSRVNQTNDIGMNCRMGMYANKTIYVDIENGKLETVDYKISDLKLAKPPKLPAGLEDAPTRLMLRILDAGALQKGSKKEEVEKKSELAVYQNKSYARTNLLFSQSLSISTPFNPSLRVGQMIDVLLPVKDGSDQSQTTGGGENDISGKYLLSELKHSIANGKSNSELKLIRDVFTA